MDFTKWNNPHENLVLELQEFCAQINNKHKNNYLLTYKERSYFDGMIVKIKQAFIDIKDL